MCLFLCVCVCFCLVYELCERVTLYLCVCVSDCLSGIGTICLVGIYVGVGSGGPANLTSLPQESSLRHYS